jgi:hypothetical protein
MFVHPLSKVAGQCGGEWWRIGAEQTLSTLLDGLSVCARSRRNVRPRAFSEMPDLRPDPIMRRVRGCALLWRRSIHFDLNEHRSANVVGELPRRRSGTRFSSSRQRRSIRARVR